VRISFSSFAVGGVSRRLRASEGGDCERMGVPCVWLLCVPLTAMTSWLNAIVKGYPSMARWYIRYEGEEKQGIMPSMLEPKKSPIQLHPTQSP